MACTAGRFLDNKNGNVSFISSAAGYIGLIEYNAYSPTKFAMTALAKCLRMEGKREGITVTITYPENTLTPLREYEKTRSC